MHKVIILMAFVLMAWQGKAQSDIPVGTWRTHNAYNSTIGMTSNGQEIVAATNSALYFYDPVQNSSEQLTSLNGLSDSQISAIGYNTSEELLLITYANGNIDLISETHTDNFRALFLADIPGSKKINHIYNDNEFAYLSADFGVMVIDLDKGEVKDSYFELGGSGETITIYSSTVQNDSLYLATEEGIICGFLEDNLKDFNQWRRFGLADGVPQSQAKIILQSTAGLLAAFDQQGLYEYTGSTWENRNLLQGKTFISGSEGSNQNILVTDTNVYLYENTAIDSISFELITEPRAAIEFDNEIVIGDFNNGLIFPAKQSVFYPNGPLSNEIVRLFGFNNKMLALPPAYDTNFNPQRNTAGFFMFEAGEWLNHNSTGAPNTVTIPEFLDITDAMYSYTSRSLYLSSFGYGIMEIKDDQYTVYDEANSSLINSSPPGNNIFVTALDANASQLSALNFNVTQPFHSLDFSAMQWTGQAISFPGQRAIQIRSYANNTQWLQLPGSFSSGIIVFDAENQRELRIDDNYLPSSRVNDLAIDLEGKMWVATDLGVVYFNNAQNILDQTFIDPVQPIYDGQLLFRNERLTALAVDGSNRLWMATSTGVWLFAEDGFKLIEYFNTENSPLPSNEVMDIAINHQSGEVFFATTAGLVSYRGTATISATEEPLKIYPNPVLRRQHDIVTIQGVATDADFWVTDSSGRLVYRSKANGNTATWPGISSNAELSSGVYFVFVSTEDGEAKQVGKIAIIN